MVTESTSALWSLILTGIVPFVTFIAIAIQFFYLYKKHIRNSFDSLELDFRKFVRQRFIEVLDDGRIGIRNATDSSLTLKHIRRMGWVAYQWYYYYIALCKTLAFATLGALSILISAVIIFAERTDRLSDYWLHVPVLDSNVYLPLSTYHEEFLKIGAVFLIVALFFGSVVIFRYTVLGNNPEVKIRNKS